MILVCYLLHGKPTIRAVTPGPSFTEAETLLVLGALVHIFGRNYLAPSSGLILTAGLEAMAFELTLSPELAGSVPGPSCTRLPCRGAERDRP